MSVGNPKLIFRVPPAWVERLTTLAAEAGVDKSTYLRSLLAATLEESNRE